MSNKTEQMTKWAQEQLGTGSTEQAQGAIVLWGVRYANELTKYELATSVTDGTFSLAGFCNDLACLIADEGEDEAAEELRDAQ